MKTSSRFARARSVLVGIVLGAGTGAGMAALAGTTGPVTDTPLVIPYDGFVTLADGPVNDTVTMRFGLHPTADCTACEQWTETQTVPVHGGRFSVGLGATTPLVDTLFERTWYLSLAIDGMPLDGRQALEPTPFAHWAARSNALTVGSIDALAGPDGGVTVGHAALNVLGTTIELGTDDGAARGTSQAQRALQATGNNDLLVNPGGDFEGGVVVDTDIDIYDDMEFAGGVAALSASIGNITAQTMTITDPKTAQVGNTSTTAVTTPTFNTEWADCGNRVLRGVTYVESAGQVRLVARCVQ